MGKTEGQAQYLSRNLYFVILGKDKPNTCSIISNENDKHQHNYNNLLINIKTKFECGDMFEIYIYLHE